MIQKRKRLTHDEHRQLAVRILAMKALAISAFFTVQTAFGKSHKASKALFRLFCPSGPISTIQSALDSEYHSVTSSEQFGLHGHVYYNDKEWLIDRNSLHKQLSELHDLLAQELARIALEETP